MEEEEIKYINKRMSDLKDLILQGNNSKSFTNEVYGRYCELYLLKSATFQTSKRVRGGNKR